HHRIRGGLPARPYGLLQCIEGAGADVAVNDAESGQGRGGDLFSSVLPEYPRGLNAVGHANVLSFRCSSLHEIDAVRRSLSGMSRQCRFGASSVVVATEPSIRDVRFDGEYWG